MIKIQTLATASIMTAAFAMAPAFAGGSIGGDCCADLEERVAELEATTVRKGNRKVSLKVTGQVNKAILWDDRATTSPDIWDNTLTGSRFTLTGKAKISSDLYAGYIIELGLGDGELATTEGNQRHNGIFNELRRNDLYIGSKTLGKISIGKGSSATEGIAEIDLSGTTYFGGGTLSYLHLTANDPNNDQSFGTTWRGFANMDGAGRKERVRYDTPSIAGFKASVSWQDNDDIDAALRFAAAFGDFKVAAGIGFVDSDATGNTQVSGSASAMHIPTGLNVTFAAGDDDNGREYYFIQGGIKQKVFAAGNTAFSVGYYDSDSDTIGTSERFTATIVQDIDAAAMKLYASFTDAEDELGEDQSFMIGTHIKF